MERKVEPIACQILYLDPTDLTTDPRAWFQSQPSVGDGAWFLAHADDGVIWGRLQGKQLLTSDSAFPQISPALRAITLQQARLFGRDAEVRAWRDDAGFRACRLEDRQDDKAEAFDEAHVLWGTRVEKQVGGFSLVSDGRQGLRHAVPLEVPDTAFSASGRDRSLRLLVRHYLTYDGDGHARIALSRLVEVRVHGGEDES
jgi:CRISPR-associated protein (TIGR03984 family)